VATEPCTEPCTETAAVGGGLEEVRIGADLAAGGAVDLEACKGTVIVFGSDINSMLRATLGRSPFGVAVNIFGVGAVSTRATLCVFTAGALTELGNSATEAL
jgi:hypothetical protein